MVVVDGWILWSWRSCPPLMILWFFYTEKNALKPISGWSVIQPVASMKRLYKGVSCGDFLIKFLTKSPAGPSPLTATELHQEHSEEKSQHSPLVAKQELVQVSSSSFFRLQMWIFGDIKSIPFLSHPEKVTWTTMANFVQMSMNNLNNLEA